MRSLRKTLVWGTSVATAATLVTAGVLLYTLVRASLLAQFDQSLLDRAQTLASAVERERGALDLGFDELDLREFEGNAPAAYLQLWLADGSLLYRSSDGELKPLGKPRKAPIFGRMTLPDGRDGRGVMFRFFPRGEHGLPAGDDETAAGTQSIPGRSRPADAVDVVLARSTGELKQTLTYLGGSLLLVGLTAVTMSTGILWWIVRRSMSPLEKLAKEIGRLTENDLAQRIDLETAPLEIQPVVERLNDLLRRLASAFRRERAFSANIAHELRNPLAGLRLRMDVATSRSRQPQEYEQAIDQCRQITGRMQTMVENLLSLAHLEAGQVQVRRERLLLGQLVRDVWKPLDAEAGCRSLNVDWLLAKEVEVVSDSALLVLLVRNILENAVVYADEGGTLRIGARSLDGEAEISVSNTGSRVSQDQAESAFEQFWRGDEARSDVGVHCGLGLSLVRKIASVLGGTAVARSRMGGDFEVVVSIPASRDDCHAC